MGFDAPDYLAEARAFASHLQRRGRASSRRINMKKEPKPCRGKYGKVSAAEFARHVKEDKCSKCLAVAQYLARGAELANALWRSRN